MICTYFGRVQGLKRLFLILTGYWMYLSIAQEITIKTRLHQIDGIYKLFISLGVWWRSNTVGLRL
jgi:hypothetical protein